MPTDEEFRDLATEYAIENDAVTIDHNAVVIHEDVGKSGECYGAYVQVWV